MFQLDEETLALAINLPDGQRIIGFRDDPTRLSIDVCVEGDGLPECLPGAEAKRINAGPYTARFNAWTMRGTDLAEMVQVIAERLDQSADGDATAYGSDLLRVLAGTYDPRVDADA